MTLQKLDLVDPFICNVTNQFLVKIAYLHFLI